MVSSKHLPEVASKIRIGISSRSLSAICSRISLGILLKISAGMRSVIILGIHPETFAKMSPEISPTFSLSITLRIFRRMTFLSKIV